jgi:hypothetical protein
MTTADHHEPAPRRMPSHLRAACAATEPLRTPADAPDPVSLFAAPIGQTTSPPDDPVPVTQTLYRTPEGRYVIRTCLHIGADPARDACDVMIYTDEVALREALSAGGDGLGRSLLAAMGLDPAGS